MGFFSKIFREVKRAVHNVVDVVEDTAKNLGVVLGVKEQDIPKTDLATTSSEGVLLNKTAATSSINVIIGTRRSGGTRVLLHTQGNKNADLYSVLVFAEGPISGIRDIEINDEKPSAFGGSDSYNVSDNSRFSLTPDVSFCAHFGAWTQSADALFSANLGNIWTSAHKLTGLAYSATKYTYNAEKISSLPTQTAVIDGALLYDPRDGQQKFSSNAALAILFYMRSDVFGERVPDDEIDFESFKVAADVADRTAETFAGAGQHYKPIDINAVIDTSKGRLDNMKALLAHAHASLPYSEGKYRLVIRSATESSFEFTDDNIVGDISVGSSGASDKYNRATVTFIDPDLNWQENTVVYPTDDAEHQQLLAEDNGIEKNGEVTADMITNKYQALDYARRYVYESRKSLNISFSATVEARKVLPGQVVTVTTSQLGSFLFSIEKRVVTADGEYKFTLKEYDPSLYSWINLTEISAGYTPTLPNVYNLPAPQNLVFSAVEYNANYQGVLSWNESNSAFVTRYKIDIYNTVTGLLAWSNTVTDNNVQVPNLPAGNYRADIKGLSEVSATPISSVSWTYSVPVLPIVSGLVQVGEFDADLSLSWSHVSNHAALRSYRVELLIDDLVIFSTMSSTENITITNAQFQSIGYPRDFDVHVSAVNVALSNGPAASLSIKKPAPAPPLSVSFTPSSDALIVRTVKAANAKGMTAWLSTVSPVEQVTENQVYSGISTRFDIGDLSPLTQYYVKLASYDAFGLGESSAHTVTTLNDAVADAINQLTERDLSLSDDIEQVAKAAAERVQKQQVETDDVAEQLFKSAARAAEMQRYQLSQNDEYYRILNAVVEIDPSNGTITNRAYEYTNNKFSEASLLIDGVNSAIALQASRIDTTNDRLTDAESELSVQAGLINQRATFTQLTETVAGAIAAIQPAYVTTFNTGLDGWVAQSGTAVYNAGAWVDLTLGDIAATMDYSGADNHVIQLSIARESGAVWAGKVQYKTASHDYSSDYEMDIPEILDDGQLYTVTVDFGDVEDYTASNITGLRIILGETTDDMYQLHSLQAGKRTAAQAAIEGLQGRVSSAEQNIDAVSGQLSNYVTTTFYEQNTLTQNDVQQTLDSWNAQYSVIAKLTELDENGTVTKANSAEQWIDGAEALISQIAQSTTQQEYGARVSAVEQTLDAQAGSISQQIVSTHQSQVDNDDLSENAFLEAANAASSAREQLKQNDTIALARSETKAVASETTALAQTVDELEVVVDENKAEFSDYRRAAIGYCVDANGNPTSHETAASCELAGNTWRGNSSIAEALRNVKVTGTNSAGETVEISAGNMYQTILEADGRGAATAALLAVYGDQLAGVFANAGEDGSSLEFIANQMKFKTQNGTKTPFRVEGDQVYANELIVDGASIKDATITSEKVVNSAITNAQIANASITSAKIANGQITNAHIANAAITSANIANGQITNAHIANAAITSAKIGDGQITNAKIGDVIQSANYSPGVSGWRILKNGSAEFNGVVVSREMTVASGTFSLGRVQGGDGTIKYDAILDTGYPANAWSGSKFYTGVAVGFVNTGVQSNTPSTSAWGVSAEVIPLTRFYSQATINLRIRVYGAYNVTLDPCNISWRLLRVT
ncbi:phage tail tip fiber protein [Marinomonas spartinae]|uniref:phage tail tip fiber protein n=1 Tax=Marinomonas spartinae TaxID=1792290 RepID=UPI0018F18C7C|nr:hypothetical protein [Marinomonas spartinae]MBJ7555380.1 hypothetical protein [Marinomonas spartinae]